jgi:hypothetical protein
VWVSDYSTVNRATLHLAPLLVFYLLALAHAAVDALQTDKTPAINIAPQ